MANPPAAAASDGRARPARNGPTTALAMSTMPATASGPSPATRYRPVPDTVPVPTSRKSTAARKRATTFELGIEPAANDNPSTAAGLISALVIASYVPRAPAVQRGSARRSARTQCCFALVDHVG